MAIKHSKTSTKTDDADTTLVRPSDWNADHIGALVDGQHGDRSGEGGTQHAHGQLSGVTADQHHLETHAGDKHSGVGVAKTVRKSGDQTVVNNSTTLANVTDLSFSVEANAAYFVEYFISAVGHSSGDIKTLFTLPAGATQKMVRMQTSGAAAIPQGFVVNDVIVMGLGDGVEGPAVAWGWLVVGGTAGTAQLQAAQNTAHASDLIVKKDSLLRYSRIA